MNEPSIFIRECKSFTKVSNSALKSDLSIIAMGLLARLLSHKDGYCIHKEVEQGKSKVGVKTFKKAWKELEDNGFIICQRVGNGKIRYKWIIVNDPELIAKKYGDNVLESSAQMTEGENPEVDNQERNTIGGNPGVENQGWNTTAGNGVSNIDISNVEERNRDTSNVDVKNIDVSTLEETIEDTPIDYEIVVEVDDLPFFLGED